jgi:hypothetical protein
MNNKSISEKQITIHCQEVGNITEENWLGHILNLLH